MSELSRLDSGQVEVEASGDDDESDVAVSDMELEVF